MYPINTASILIWLGYKLDIDFEVYSDSLGNITIDWYSTAPKPTVSDILNAAKSYAASVKQEEIYREQEIRATTVFGAELDRNMFSWIEEIYTKLIVPAAKNNITQIDSPITYGLKQLRDNRDTLLAGLQTWVDDPTKTSTDIENFDVINWSGWTIARPQ